MLLSCTLPLLGYAGLATHSTAFCMPQSSLQSLQKLLPVFRSLLLVCLQKLKVAFRDFCRPFWGPRQPIEWVAGLGPSPAPTEKRPLASPAAPIWSWHQILISNRSQEEGDVKMDFWELDLHKTKKMSMANVFLFFLTHLYRFKETAQSSLIATGLFVSLIQIFWAFI